MATRRQTADLLQDKCGAIDDIINNAMLNNWHLKKCNPLVGTVSSRCLPQSRGMPEHAVDSDTAGTDRETRTIRGDIKLNQQTRHWVNDRIELPSTSAGDDTPTESADISAQLLHYHCCPRNAPTEPRHAHAATSTSASVGIIGTRQRKCELNETTVYGTLSECHRSIEYRRATATVSDRRTTGRGRRAGASVSAAASLGPVVSPAR